jgi:hypothetical protein
LFKHRSSLRHLLAGLLLTGMLAGGRAGEVATEAQLKAAYLINFLKYVEWPVKSETAVLCLRGRNEVFSHLQAYEGRQVGTRELSIRQLQPQETPAGCHELFVSATSSSTNLPMPQGGQALLIVSDNEAFADQGGMIALVRVGGRLQFDINTDAMSRAGLKPASQLIRLARRTIGNTP